MDNKPNNDLTARNFPSAEEDAHAATPPSRYGGPESAFRLAFTDTDFLLRDELRPVRMQLELLKPELVQRELGIESTIVIFGSARILSPEQARSQMAEAEQAVLGCILLAPTDCLVECAERWGATPVFYDLRHQLIYDTCQRLHSANRVVDLVTLVEELKAGNNLEKVGGPAFIGGLSENDFICAAKVDALFEL
jgi:hypothetical protein